MPLNPSNIFVLKTILALILALKPAITIASSMPGFERLRNDEDWRFWCQENTFSQSYQYKCLDSVPGLVSLGGEARLRFASTHNPGWGKEAVSYDDAYFQRYVVFADWNVSSSSRIFFQLNSAIVTGSELGPSPVDENTLDIQQAFYQYSISDNWQVSVGRQELHLGSGRLVDVREGPNVRRKYDAISSVSKMDNWLIKGFWAKPIRVEQGTFDDEQDTDQSIWGAYAVLNGERGLNSDFYYIGYRHANNAYLLGRGKEQRHTLGSRLWGNHGPVTINWELIFQLGTFDDKNIRAWSFASETRFKLNSVKSASFGVSANIASGDTDPSDGKLETFNAVFPRGNYFSEIAILGPRNFYNLQPYLMFEPIPDVSFTTGINLYWRLSSKDGVYGPGGNLIDVATSSTRKYVATELSFSSSWQFNRHAEFTFVLGRSLPAKLVKQAGSANSTNYLECTVKLLF